MALQPQSLHSLPRNTVKENRGSASRARTLFLVESPAKAKKVGEILGNEYEVLASYGHVRSLPRAAGAVIPEDNFKMLWQVMPRQEARLQELAEKARKAKAVLLATDPDREGEAISWHLHQYLKEKGALASSCKVERITFNAVTPVAVQEAMQQPRCISQGLVNAYFARISMDYLLGFHMSPILWRKLPGCSSAGRVQSPALRLLCDREMERDLFKPEKYYSMSAALQPRGSDPQVPAQVVAVDGEKVEEKAGNGITQERAQEVVERLNKAATAEVISVKFSKSKMQAKAPYRTSTLQQDASHYLGLTVKQTMSAAQRLFEEGLITYHRTDGLDLSEERLAAIREHVAALFPGPNRLSSTVRKYKREAKNAQEAHEAITVVKPAAGPKVNGHFSRAERMLHELIFRRSLACQMEPATFKQVRVTFSAAGCVLSSSGTVLEQAGHLEVWQEARHIRSRYPANKSDANDDKDNAAGSGREDSATGSGALDGTDEDPESESTADGSHYKALASLKMGAEVALTAAEVRTYETAPPGMFQEASLVKALEQLGIGRPATYASTISTLLDRGYIGREGQALRPTAKGRLLAAFLEKHFRRWVNYDFTSEMEELLDSISRSQTSTNEALNPFWSHLCQDVAAVQDIEIPEVLKNIEAALELVIFPPRDDGGNPRVCPACSTGRLQLRISTHGGFVACSNGGKEGSCTFRRGLIPRDDLSIDEQTKDGRLLGVDPLTRAEVRLLQGPYGPYLQRLGQDKTKDRLPLPGSLSPNSVTLEDALKLFSWTDISLGQHPETGLDLQIKSGRFGKYYAHGNLICSIGNVPDDFEASFEHAMARLDSKAKRLGTTQAEGALKETRTQLTGEKPKASKPQRVAPRIAEGPLKATRKRRTGKKPKASKPQRVAQRIAGKDGPATSGPSDALPGNRPYFAWLAHYRERTGADLRAARQAYQSLSEQDKTVWKEQWANAQAASS